jgi:hypothetical protein
VTQVPPMPGGGRRPASRLFVWSGGRVIWRSRPLQPFAWGTTVGRTHKILYASRGSVRVLSPRGGKRLLRFSPPWAFSYFPPIRADRSGDFAAIFLVVTPRHGASSLSFEGSTPIGVEVFDLRTGRTARALFHGSPECLGFSGRSLVVCTDPIAAGGLQTSLLAPTNRAGKLRLLLTRQGRTGRGGYAMAEAGGTPVVIQGDGSSISIGHRVIRPPGGFRGIREVVGARAAVLVIQNDGRFGVAGAPTWRYQRLGRIELRGLCGTGHNRREFWIAQPGLKITLIGPKGKLRTVAVPMPAAAGR